MILFCDTSALVKLYIKEAFSEVVSAHTEKARMIAVSRICWAETMATLARRARESSVDAAMIDKARAVFRANWASFGIVELTQPLVELAGDYADTFALRAYASIQLASARMLQSGIAEELCFACFDTRLNKAASVLGMTSLSDIV